MLYRQLLVSSSVLLGGVFAQDPCESANSYRRGYYKENPNAVRALIPAEIAEECLNTVPVDKEEDLALIDEYKLWLSWQSNLEWHKNPPEGFGDGSVDVIGELDKIRKNLVDDQYNTSYELMGDIQAAAVRAHDYHFQLRPWIRNTVVGWMRSDGAPEAFAMVSVSKDGQEVPKLYDYHDILKSDSSDWSPSPISKINNQTAEDYAETFAAQYEYHNGDARYNRLFPSQAIRSTTTESNDYTPFGRSAFPDGASTIIEHENGTIHELDNIAVVAGFWNDYITSTEALAARAYPTLPTEVTPTSTQEAIKARQATAIPSSSPLGYPVPAAWSSLGGGGFVLEGEGYEDVAVLSVTTFDPEQNDYAVEWMDLVGEFLSAAHQIGKTKLVIDLRGNGGGKINLGYDLFQQLFPSQYPYGASTFHAHEALDLTGQAVAEALSNITYEEAVQLNQGTINYVTYQSMFNYRVPMTIEEEPFRSWEEYFGPQLTDGGNVTTPQRRNMTNYFADAASGQDITGYGTRVNKLNRTQFFEPENMVILSDGSCGSTCSIFLELMKSQGRVQQIAIGGLPKTGPMQAGGGTKGSQVLSIKEIRDSLLDIAKFTSTNWEGTIVSEMLNATRPFTRDAGNKANGLGSSTRVNIRDNIRQNDTSLTPLEFVYEAADCRLFYTAEMVRNVTAVWKKTVDARWGDANKTCVEGSTMHPSSLSGGVFDNASKDNNRSSDQPGSGEKKANALRSHSSNTVLLAAVSVVGMLMTL